jgi:hypothetical protein
LFSDYTIQTRTSPNGDPIEGGILCPFLGLQEDRNTAAAFPSHGNTCYCDRKPAVVVLENQASTCLIGGYLTCPVYLQAQKAADSARIRLPLWKKVPRFGPAGRRLAGRLGDRLMSVLPGAKKKAFIPAKDG